MPKFLIIVLKWIFTWSLVYILSFALSVVFGISTISGVKEFFALYPVNSSDHVFAVLLTGAITAMGYCLVRILHSDTVVKYPIAKTVFASCVIYIPVMFLLACIFTAT